MNHSKNWCDMDHSTRRGASTDLKAASSFEDVSHQPFGERLKWLRQSRGFTLKELRERSGISISTLSKIERGRLSPTYEKIVSLAKGLNVDVASLFTDNKSRTTVGRRSITRHGNGIIHDTINYTYELLCTDIVNRDMTPAITRVKCHDRKTFGPLGAHDGEDLIYVISGSVILYTEFYTPIRMNAGDCAYFDSRMGHGCVSANEEDALLFWVTSSAAREPRSDGG